MNDQPNESHTDSRQEAPAEGLSHIKLESASGPPPVVPSTQFAPAQPVVPTIRVHAESPHGVVSDRPTAFKIIGLILLLIGANVCAFSDESWDHFIRPMNGASGPTVVGGQAAGSVIQERASGTTDSAPSTAAAEAPAASSSWIDRQRSHMKNMAEELKYRWRWLLIGGVFVGLALVCLGGSQRAFLGTAVLVVATGHVAAGLLATKLQQYFGAVPTTMQIINGGLGLAYLIHALGSVQPLKFSSLVGSVLTLVAGAGVLHGWFEYPGVAEKVGGQLEQTISNWRPEFTWGTVLLLTMIGVIISRNRTTHFLNAVLLAALAYYCIHEGSLKVFDYPGTGWAPISLRDIDHVPTWRWVLVGELILLSAVLLHLSLGVGTLAVVFACVWLGCVLHVDKEMGRDALVAYSQAMEQAMSRPEPTGIGGESRRQGPADILPGFGGRKNDEPRPVFSNEQKQALLQKAQIRISVVYAWVYVTALLSGMIAACGLRMLIPEARRRQWALLAIWLVFGAAGFWLWNIWPAGQNWESRLTAFVVPRTHVYGIVVGAIAMLALVGAVMLRWNSRYSASAYTAATVTFIGTVFTLIGLAVLIKFTGHTQMAVWKYAAIALGQSSLMWVLLIHQSDRARRGALD